MERIILNWDEVVNSYEGPDIFEFWFCNEMREKVETYGDPEDIDAIFERLTERYGNSKFFVSHHDYIKWHGKLNNDFRLSEVIE